MLLLLNVITVEYTAGINKLCDINYASETQW